MSQYDDNDSTIDNKTGEIIAVEPVGGLQPVITAEINQAVATAHKYPRRQDRAIINEIVGRSTLDEEIAGECSYTLKRGNKQISGPSIRFAEIVRASYGNIRVASRFVALDMADPERAAVIVEAVALDLEMNQSEIIPNRRSIMTSGTNGRKPQIYSADMINMTVNAASSIARRNAILSVIPKALWQPGYQRVVKVLMGDADTLVQRREKLIEAFSRFDVNPEALFASIGVGNVGEIKVDHMPIMIGMLTAIKDGEQVDSVLGRRGVVEGSKHEAVQNPLKDRPDDNAGQISQTIARNADAATQGAQAEAARRNPDDLFRGDARAFASADFVVARSGKILKDRGETPKQTIVDERYDAGGEIFKDLAEWLSVCAENNLPTELGQKWKQAEPSRTVAGDGVGRDGETNYDAGEDGEPAGDQAGAAGKPADASSAGTATERPAAETNAPRKAAANPAPARKTFESEEDYIGHMRDVFDRATSKTAINEAWSTTREDRRELLGAAEVDALTTERDAALKRFAVKG